MFTTKGMGPSTLPQGIQLSTGLHSCLMPFTTACCLFKNAAIHFKTLPWMLYLTTFSLFGQLQTQLLQSGCVVIIVGISIIVICAQQFLLHG